MKLAVIIALLFSCTDEGAARQALQDQGFTDIKITGYSWACGKDDMCTGFEATGPTGRHVRGAVGCGYGCKGCTLRLL